MLNIPGVQRISLKEIATEGGSVLHILRADSAAFTTFGEVYCSEILPGAVRAWKRHREQTQRFAVPVGLLRLVLFDDRHAQSGAGTVADLVLGRPGHYDMLILPPGIWYGFAAAGADPALIVNCTDMPHRPEETDRLPQDAIFFDWNSPCAI